LTWLLLFSKEEGRGKREEGRRKKEEGRGRRKKNNRQSKI
jgi:hypothetical protein